MGVWVDEGLKPLAERIASALGADAIGWEIVKGELSLSVRREAIVRVLTYLRDDEACKFGALMDVCGVDWPERAERFDVVYNLLSMRHNRRIRVKLATDENAPVPSVVGVFPSANWFEREAWDL
jgi:NADH-quinone oxidoreductase subunit C